MQDTDLRTATQPTIRRTRRRNLLVGIVAVVALAVAGTLWFLATRDSGDQAATGAWPSPRFGSAVAFDEGTGVMVLFGGTADDVTGLDDTWVYDPGSGVWTEQQPATSPSPRSYARAAYDPGLDRIVLFGGIVDGDEVLGDLWLYDTDAAAWQEVVPDGPKPSPRFLTNMEYVDSLDAILAYGGNAPGPVGFDETWLLDTSTMTWTEVPAGLAGPYPWAKLAYDPVADRVVAVQPIGDSTYVFEFDPATVTWMPHQSGDVGADSWPMLVWDPVSGLIIAEGATYSIATDSWGEIPWSAPVGPGNGVVDPERQLLLLLYPFGIDQAETALEEGGDWNLELWEYDLVARTARLVGP